MSEATDEREERLVNAALVVASCKLDGMTHVYNGRRRLNGTAALVAAAEAYAGTRIKELEAEVHRLTRITNGAENACDDLNVQCRFWRQAAEHAVNGWNKLEDKLDAVVQRLQAGDHEDASAMVGDVLEMLVEEDPLEPGLEEPTHDYAPIDLGDGQKLRVVEEETPIAHAGIVGPTEK